MTISEIEQAIQADVIAFEAGQPVTIQADAIEIDNAVSIDLTGGEAQIKISLFGFINETYNYPLNKKPVTFPVLGAATLTAGVNSLTIQKAA